MRLANKTHKLDLSNVYHVQSVSFPTVNPCQPNLCASVAFLDINTQLRWGIV